MNLKGSGLNRLRGWTESSARRRGDDGQVMLLTLVYTLISFSLIVVAVDATAVHLARTQLWDAADAAALDAADAIDVWLTYGSPAVQPEEGLPSAAEGSGADAGVRPSPGDVLVLTDATVRARVADYLTTYEMPSRLTDVRMGAAIGSPDGRGSQVELTGLVHLPIGGAVVAAWSDGISITVLSHAQARLR